MIKHADSKIKRALINFDVPDPLTVETLFAAVQKVYPRPLELWRGDPPLVGLRANGLWLTLPEREGDAIWVAPELTGAAAVHTLAHEIGHITLGHTPVKLPAAPEPEPYEFLSPAFLGGDLIGRPRSQDGVPDPEYVRIEEQAEQFAFALRREAARQAIETRYRADPLLDRLHRSI